MNQLNSIILEGNVVKKAELSEPTSGFIVCKFPLAVNRKTKTPAGEFREEVSYFDVETYGQMAEKCSKYCDKGKGVRVVGRLKQSRWEENNVKHSKVYVVAEHIEYKFSKAKDAGTEQKPAEQNAEAQASPAPAPVSEEQKSEEVKAAEAQADAVVQAEAPVQAEQKQTEGAVVF